MDNYDRWTPFLYIQIRKCEDRQCCSEPKLEQQDRVWVPDPVIDDQTQHYQPMLSVRGSDTTDSNRPGLKPFKETAKDYPNYFMVDQKVCTVY